MLHLWTHTRHRVDRLGRSFTYVFLPLSVLHHCLLLLSSISVRTSPQIRDKSKLSRSATDHCEQRITHVNADTIERQHQFKIRQKIVHLFRLVFSLVWSVRLFPVLACPTLWWFLFTIILSLSPCSAFSLADAAPAAPSPKATQTRKSGGVVFGTHDNLQLTGARAPPPKVLMPPLDLGFKGQTGSDSRKPGRSTVSRKRTDYQSDAASNARWEDSSSIVEEDQDFGTPRSQYGSRKNNRGQYYPHVKRKSSAYGPTSEQNRNKPASYSNESPSYQAAWNPYQYPTKSAKESSASAPYYADYQTMPNNRGYGASQNAPYSAMLNHRPYRENAHQPNPYQHPYLQWESTGFGNVNPSQQNQNQPVMPPYPYVRYDVGPRAVGEPYGRWETAATYYQPAAQPFWNPYAQAQTGWYVPAMGAQPLIQGGQPIQIVPPNLQTSPEMRPTSVIGHPSNYREISREEMSQRVREYEQAQQTAENGDLNLPPLTNTGDDARSKVPVNSGSTIHDNGLFLSGNAAHDTAVRNFVNVASEWSSIGVDALFDEIDLNGDGAIRLEELRKFLRLHEAHIHR